MKAARTLKFILNVFTCNDHFVKSTEISKLLIISRIYSMISNDFVNYTV